MLEEKGDEKENINPNNPFQESNEETFPENEQTERIEQEAEDLQIEEDENDLKEELEALNNKYIRLAADFDNYRKRAEQQQRDALKYGAEETLTKLISVLDNFERAKKSLEGIEDCAKAKESLEVLNKQFIEALEKMGLEKINTDGQIFDPNFHEAVMQTPTDDYPEHQIINELQAGYKLKDKVLRPALVNVATEKDKE